MAIPTFYDSEYGSQTFLKLSPSPKAPLPILSLSFSLDRDVTEEISERLSKSTGDSPVSFDFREVGEALPHSPKENLEASLAETPHLIPSRTEFDFANLPFHQADRNLCSVGCSWMNVDKNLYPTNFWACDSTRVLLTEPISAEEEMAGFEPYYNGNYITISEPSSSDPESEKLTMIVCQGTKSIESVEPDFWRMVFHNRVPAILMLTRLSESGKVKCSRYFPNPGESKTWGPSSSVSKDGVCVRSLKWVDEGYAEISSFEVTIGDHTPIQVEHFFYKSWRDFDVPDHSQFSYFLARFLESWLSRKNPSPAVVHCSAGLGRSGCVALIIKILENPGVEPMDLLRDLRKERHGLVQTYEQFEFACSFRESI